MFKRLPALLVAFAVLVSTLPAWAIEPGVSSSAAAGESVKVGSLDLAIILFYLIGIVLLGCWAGMGRKGRCD